MEKDNKIVSREEIEDLVLKSQGGDTGSFSVLYDLFVDKIYRYFAFRMDREEAFDMTETVFLKSWENLNKYKPSNAGFKSWIFRIAHNLLIDHYRYSRVHAELDEKMSDESDSSQPKVVAEKVLMAKKTREALDKLKPKYREILVLKYINDLSNEEIAKVLGKSEIYIRVLQHRAIKDLKEIMVNENYFGNN